MNPVPELSARKTLILSGEGLRLDAKGSIFQISRNDQSVTKIPSKWIERVLVENHSKIQASALAALVRERLPVVFSDRYGKNLSSLSPEISTHPKVLIAQVKLLSDPLLSTRFSQACIGAKIRASTRIIRMHASNYPNPVFKDWRRELQYLEYKVEDCECKSGLLGIEGQAAVLHFKAFARMIRNPDFVFHTRKRRPPPDPVNALLSLGYSILVGKFELLLKAHGIEPTLGFFHSQVSGRPSLALDLMEPFRPWLVDRLVLRIINRKQIQPHDFDLSSDACLLGPGGRKIFYSSFEESLRENFGEQPSRESIHDRMEREVVNLKNHLLGKQSDWLPYQTQVSKIR